MLNYVNGSITTKWNTNETRIEIYCGFKHHTLHTFSIFTLFLQPLTAFEGFSLYVDILEKEKNGFRESWIGTT